MIFIVNFGRQWSREECHKSKTVHVLINYHAVSVYRKVAVRPCVCLWPQLSGFMNIFRHSVDSLDEWSACRKASAWADETNIYGLKA